MSIVNDLKKLLFGAKAVTQSAADKAVEAGKEAGSELIDKTSDFIESARQTAETVTEKAWDSTGEFLNKAMDKAEEIGEVAKEKATDIWDSIMDKKESVVPDPPAPQPEMPFKDDGIFSAPPDATPTHTPTADAPPSKVEELGKNVLDTAEKVGAKVMEHGGEALEKVMGAAEQLGEKVLPVMEDAGEKIMHVAEDIGGKILEKGGETLERAKILGNDLLEKASGLMERAQEEAAKENMDDTIRQAQNMGEEAARKASATDFSKPPIDTKEGLLDKHESFFERAARFAEGDYNSQPEIRRDPNYTSAPKPEGSVAGFFDNDGDGNELIDDAIIDDSEEPRP